MAIGAMITYVRVSTSRQGRSGLGIEAQRQTLWQFATAEGPELGASSLRWKLAKFSDALDRSPQLRATLAAANHEGHPMRHEPTNEVNVSAKAVELCDCHGAPEFLSAELGADVDPFVQHLFAALAEK
jgi:hypothetical protein